MSKQLLILEKRFCFVHLSNDELEKLEQRNFEKMLSILKSNKRHIIYRLKSGSYIKRNWRRKLKKVNEIEKSIERIITAVLLRELKWQINSNPVSSDLCFEIKRDAILHLDCKSVKFGDVYGDDLPGTFVIGENQASYPGNYTRIRGEFRGLNLKFKPNLPKYYHHRNFGDIPCLTYFLKIVYEVSNFDFNLKSINFYCLPNGQLTYYGNLVKGVKFYDNKTNPTRILTPRINVKKMNNKSQTRAGWNRAIENF